VYVKDYGAVAEDWQFLGQTPLGGARVSRGFKRFRITKDGFTTVEGAAFLEASVELKLHPTDSVPPEMVAVSGGRTLGWVTGIDPLRFVGLGDFLIDKYEVTNAQFKEFVDSRGYERPEFWRHEFETDGRIISWGEAMARFRDATNRPGPATWELGDFPDGLDDHPVTGVSWYEAAAYAEFAGKSLPTIYHWIYAAGTTTGTFIIPLSNFSGDTTAPVGSYQGMSPSGVYDMAGNVREWLWNESRNQRYILGGAWNQQTYTFTHAIVQDPFGRSPMNGFRCARYIGIAGMPEEASRPVELVVRDYSNETPVSQEVFEVYKSQFFYDDTELNAIIESTDRPSDDFTREKITFDAAYGDERVTAFLFLPTAVSIPYQAVVAFPGSNAMFRTSSDMVDGSADSWINIVLKSGRALIYPVYKGTYERNDGLTSTWPDQTHTYVDYVRKWVMDLRRSVDYLATREDVDTDRLAYLGFSWGGRMGAIIPAVEDRFKASILYSGGLAAGRSRPEVDQINYVTRVEIPVLMLNGRYDSIEPVETAQLPMFRLFGTPDEDKRHVIYEAGHSPLPRNDFAREVVDWLDRYLGPVR
jgi:formylglycine-generating enzyme required for sulfatase activity/cephalosporin-C deacetylase-like acetyl esterase